MNSVVLAGTFKAVRSSYVCMYVCLYGMLHTQFAKDCSLWSPRAQQTHSERSRWSR